MAENHDHEHYEHYDAESIQRLDRGWGHVDRAINHTVARLLPPEGRILDLGCGFGSLSAALSREGRAAVGVDMLGEGLRAARRRFPSVALLRGDVTALPLKDGGFEAVVVKDALHHFAHELPMEQFFAEVERLGVRTMVVVDPNPNPILLAARRLIGHVDPVCGPSEAAALLEQNGFEVERIKYGILFSLPLSGGYVGPVLLPRWRLLWTPLLSLESALCRVLRRVGLERHLCWRYFLSARRRT